MLKSSISGLAIFVFLAFSLNTRAGDIPGIPSTLPPGLHEEFQIQLSNDFFTLLDNADDFRTQQTSISAYLNSNWMLILDQSLLTVRGPRPELPDPPGTEGRLDQISASLAYQYYRKEQSDKLDQLLLGAGLRSYGDFAGARIQNGVHRILNDDLLDLPYVDTSRTDAVVWLRGSHHRYLFPTDKAPTKSNWRLGYWLDGSALQTSDGQFDATLGAYGLVKYKEMDAWFGLRGDWRNGYDRDLVQQAVAEHESGAALAFGLAYGPVRLETVEGIGDNSNSFGRIVLSARHDPEMAGGLSGPVIAYQFGLLSPEVAVQNQLRWSPHRQSRHSYRYALVFDHRYSTAAKNNNATQFNISQQYAVGIEASIAEMTRYQWIQPYLMVALGYRSEYLEGQGTLAGIQSDKADSAVLLSDAGVRLHMAGRADSWRLQFQLGLTGWLPLSSEDVNFNNQRVEILKSDTSWISGISIVWRY